MEVYGIVFMDNPRMATPFRSLGSKVRLSMDYGEYIVRLRLKR